jgi:hypothetical protein
MRGEPECFALLEQQTEVLNEPRGSLGQVLEYFASRHISRHCVKKQLSSCLISSVWDPDPYVFEPPGSGSVSQRYGYGSFYHQAKIVRKTLIPAVL